MEKTCFSNRKYFIFVSQTTIQMYHKMNTKETDNSMIFRNEALCVTLPPIRAGKNLVKSANERVKELRVKNFSVYIRELIIKDLINNKS